MGDVLSSSDLALLLTLAEEGRGEEPGPILPWFLFERMAALIPGDNLCFADLNFVQLRGENHQGILDGGQRWVGRRRWWRQRHAAAVLDVEAIVLGAGTPGKSRKGPALV